MSSLKIMDFLLFNKRILPWATPMVKILLTIKRYRFQNIVVYLIINRKTILEAHRLTHIL